MPEGHGLPQGITKKVDDMGRLVIPRSIREAMGIGKGTSLQFALDGNQLILRRQESVCRICLQHKATTTVAVCETCLRTGQAARRKASGNGGR